LFLQCKLEAIQAAQEHFNNRHGHANVVEQDEKPL